MVIFKDNSSSIHKTILNSIGEAVFIHNAETGIVEDVNESMLQMYGYERTEVIGKTVEDLSATNEGFTIDKALSRIQSAIKGNIESFEWKAKRKDNSTFWVEVSLKLAEYANQKWLIAVVRDISHNKKTELKVKYYAEFQKILAELSTTFISLPIEDFDEAINQALELLGKNFESDRAYIFIYSDDYSTMSNTHEWCNNDIIPFKNELQDIPSNFFEWNHKQLIIGKTINVPDVSKLEEEAAHEKEEFEKEGIQSILIVPFVHNNQVIGFIGIDFVNKSKVFYDEDEYSLKAFGNIIGQALVRKRNEEAIQYARLKAEESDKLKSAFLSNMSHEIRTPMNGIVGFAELLIDPGLPDEEKASYIKIINESSVKLLSIINDIIDISKIEAGQITLNIEPVNVDREIQSIVDFFSPIASNKGIELSFINKDSSKTRGLLLDKAKFNQIINNLVSNAIKYTHEGIVRIKLSVEKNSLSVLVKDTGIGIDKDNFENIFKRFVREDNEFTRITGGNGLGLAIIQGFIDKMEGSIKVNSTKGIGSEFTVFIPIIEP